MFSTIDSLILDQGVAVMDSVTQKGFTNQSPAYLKAESSWEACKPPYTNSQLRVCVTAAKTILAEIGKPRRSKYERESYLRIDFSKAGKVTFYSEYPKKMGLKGRKLGEWPEMQIQIAREKAEEEAATGLSAESVHQAVDAMIEDLRGKVARGKLSERSFETYCVRLKKWIRPAFGERELFCDVQYPRIIEILDGWIRSPDVRGSYAIELFAELRRLWTFGAPLFAGGRNVADMVPADYVSSRVHKATPSRRYTDLDAIAQLWVNVGLCSSQQQRNAVRYMIMTGVRPINVTNLMWEYVSEDLSEIVYPAGTEGMRGAMKTQKEFRLPVSPSVKAILLEQKQWRDSAPAGSVNQDYVFVMPRKPTKPFQRRCLDKLVKTHTPSGAIYGEIGEHTVKGRDSAFCTMCRKFLKSNLLVQLRAAGYSRADATEISKLCMHHSDKARDPMAEHYDFSDELSNEEMELKRIAMTAHDSSIMEKVYKITKG